LNVPFDSRGDSGIVYAWIGSKASDGEANLVQEIAQDFCSQKEEYSMMVGHDWRRRVLVHLESFFGH
jgi:hypothetical protein